MVAAIETIETLSKSRFFNVSDQTVVDFTQADQTEIYSGQSAADTAPLRLTGTTVDQKYKILSLLGEGGMGAVYLAHHLALNKDVALKTFKSANISDGIWARFQREAQSIAKLNHKNIVHVYDFGFSEANVPYYTMEYLTGESLDARLHREGTAELTETLKIFLQVAEGLAVAHKKGIIHRDIKPANIFLTDNDKIFDSAVKLVDFGIAGLAADTIDDQKLTSAGTIFGSPLYMSPEQAMGNPLGPPSDIYSFACTLFEALSGKPPYRGENSFATMIMHQVAEIPSVGERMKSAPPLRLQSLIRDMMAKDPADRPQTFEAVEATLQDILNTLNATGKAGQGSKNIVVPADETAYEQKTSRQGRQFVLLGLTALILAGGAGFAFLPAMLQPPKTDKLLNGYATKAEEEFTLNNSANQKFVPFYLYKDQLGNTRYGFPGAPSLGKLQWQPDPKLPPCPDNLEARGEVIVPTAAKLTLIADEGPFNDPSLFDRFGADDIFAMTFRDRFDFTDEHVKHISRLSGIKLLNMRSPKITDNSFEYLARLRNVVSLDLKTSKYSPAKLATLPALTNLNTLEISYVWPCAPLLDKLPTCKNLWELSLIGCQLKDSDMETLARMPSLKALDISDNPAITAAGLEALTKVKKLENLAICNTKLDLSCAPVFKRIPGLKLLTVTTDLWPPKDVKALEKAIPGLKIDAKNSEQSESNKKKASEFEVFIPEDNSGQ